MTDRMKRTMTAMAAAMLSVALVSCSDLDGPSEAGAEVSCEQRVKEQLKSPSSADFDGTTARAVTETEYAVSGTVDSENGFGAMLRSEFTCTVQFRDDGTFARVDSLE